MMTAMMITTTMTTMMTSNSSYQNHYQATLAAYARRKFSSGEISTEHMRNIMKVQNLIIIFVIIFQLFPLTKIMLNTTVH